MSVLFHRIEVCSCESKVCEFDVYLALLIDEDVLRFEVSVDDAVSVTKLKG